MAAGRWIELQRVLDADPLPSPADRDALLTIGIGLQMTAGRWKDARELAKQMFQERLRDLHLAVLADAVDDMAALRRAFRLRVLARLSGKYRELGRYAEADAIDARLRRLLVLADSDHPLLTQLASRGQQQDQVP